MEKYKCIICKKEFDRISNLKDFLIFSKDKKQITYNKNNSFVICRNDLNIMGDNLKDIKLNLQSYKEHFDWYQKEKKLLKIAKIIYSKCKNNHKKVDLNKVQNKIYDLMCEECWDKFSVEKERV